MNSCKYPEVLFSKCALKLNDNSIIITFSPGSLSAFQFSLHDSIKRIHLVMRNEELIILENLLVQKVNFSQTV